MSAIGSLSEPIGLSEAIQVSEGDPPAIEDDKPDGVMEQDKTDKISILKFFLVLVLLAIVLWIFLSICFLPLTMMRYMGPANHNVMVDFSIFLGIIEVVGIFLFFNASSQKINSFISMVLFGTVIFAIPSSLLFIILTLRDAKYVRYKEF
jgi:hypothetical protein